MALEWPLAWFLVLAAAFFFTFFNRFVGLRSGDGEYGAGIAFLHGLRPYRDYFTAGPPLNQYKAALELAIGGRALIVSRTCGVLERLGIALLLYVWLRRMFTPLACGIASFVTIIAATADRTDPIASYNHDALLFAMLCGYLATLSLPVVREGRAARHPGLLAGAAGVCAGCSFLSKQTVGAAAFVSVLVFGVVAVSMLSSYRRVLAWCAAFLVGFLLPTAAVVQYLWHAHLLRACVDMLFISGPAAKAGKSHQFLTREILIAFANINVVIVALVAFLLSARGMWKAICGVGRADENAPARRRQWTYVLMGATLVVVVAELLALTSLPAVHDVGKAPIYYVLLACAVFGIRALVHARRAQGHVRSRLLQVALFASLSWSVAAALSLSWPAFEAMVLPGLGLLIAAAVDGTRGWGTHFLYLVLSALVFILIREKLDLPFSFDHQDEAPVRFAVARSTQPALRGMRLPPEAVRLLDDAVRTIHAHAGPRDTIFTYPEMGIIYSLSGHRAPTWTDSHNIDVVQDSFARQEAQRLLAGRPAVLLYARPTEAQLRKEEFIWRGGQPSGQRDLIRAMDTLTANYDQVGTYQLLPGDTPIQMYVRRPEAPVIEKGK